MVVAGFCLTLKVRQTRKLQERSQKGAEMADIYQTEAHLALSDRTSARSCLHVAVKKGHPS